MHSFKNILVGVDLSSGDKLVYDDLSPSTSSAVDRAIWLAELNSAHLEFFYTLDIGYHAQYMIEEDSGMETTIVTSARRILAQFVERAEQRGITARAKVTFGKSWFEIIQQVLNNRVDLVIVGAKARGALERLFIGSTGMKLLRKCPCPVWITHPPRSTSHGAILVAHDLTEVGTVALGLGASMAELHDAPLHVVHALEAVNIDAKTPTTVFASKGDDAIQKARQTIESQLERFELKSAAQIHIAAGAAATVLLQQIEEIDVDLLVMGTIARSGIDGLLFGNTAERLLPQVRCSVIAVKPSDFQSPISMRAAD